MKERPILFSSEMVKALLADRKNQTRRVVKADFHHGFDLAKITPICSEFLLERWPEAERAFSNFGRCDRIRCPYGVVGDRLWVRESTIVHGSIREQLFGYVADGCEATEHWEKKMPSIHMRRAHCRITLEITSVRVERLQDISEADAIAEGVKPLFDLETTRRMPECDLRPMPWRNYLWHGLVGRTITQKQSDDWKYQYSSYKTAVGSYSSLWESINGKGSWDRCDWVWVLNFKRVGLGE